MERVLGSRERREERRGSQASHRNFVSEYSSVMGLRGENVRVPCDRLVDPAATPFSLVKAALLVQTVISD